MRINALFFLLLLFFWGTTAAQEGFIQGKLVDAQTGEPVVFATVKIKDKAIGVISNQDGGFRIPIRFKEKKDTLVISSMGYRKITLPSAGLSSQEENIIKWPPECWIWTKPWSLAKRGEECPPDES